MRPEVQTDFTMGCELINTLYNSITHTLMDCINVQCFIINQLLRIPSSLELNLALQWHGLGASHTSNVAL